MMMRAALERFIGYPSDVVVLGLDSLSHHDDIAALKSWTNARHGTWYEYAVAPGLLTNAVWSSILTMTPVSTHHVFHTFERLTMPSVLLAAARAKGYHTVSAIAHRGEQLVRAADCKAGVSARVADDLAGEPGRYLHL